MFGLLSRSPERMVYFCCSNRRASAGVNQYATATP
uniref:Uncharacterized protein n=1 Tax=Anguilla anguilla TaxID=7936 RepID=A0A0E9UW80_ANGAN